MSAETETGRGGADAQRVERERTASQATSAAAGAGGSGANARAGRAAQGAPRSPQAPERPDPYQADVRTKDHVAAGLLAIFFGWLGIHKFYLGYYDAGFIMLAITVVGSLLTFGIACGVVEVLAIIEGIVYLTKSQSEFEDEYVFRKREWF